jgi:molybdopterin-synthase adenylyltransferase
VRDLTLYDYDIIEESNLQRQSLYTTADVGRLKVEAAKEHLIAIDPMCLVTVHASPFSGDVDVGAFTLIIDGTDSLEARFLLNDAAKSAGVPLVIGAASGTGGAAFLAREDVCWQCITLGKKASDDCDTGVLNMATHAIACMQAALALRHMLGAIITDLLEFDIWHMEFRKIQVKRNDACLACKGSYKYLFAEFSLRFCTVREKLIATPNIPSVVELERVRENREILKDYGNAIIVALGEGSVLVHRHGAMEFTNVEEAAAREFAKEILR